jgi:hypothetical protein
MKTVIRCHIKNKERLDIAERTFISFIDKGIDNVHIMDDGSPLQNDVRKLCKDVGFTYHRAGGDPHTINGLVESLKLAPEGEKIFCCVDDIVLGKGAAWVLEQIQIKEIPALEAMNIPWATIGIFACYPKAVRKIYPGTLLWNMDWQILYALNSHIYSPEIIKAALDKWKLIKCGELPFPKMCDDIWIARLAEEHKLLCFNSLDDFAQHTGAGARTFDMDAGSSYYKALCFVGE